MDARFFARLPDGVAVDAFTLLGHLPDRVTVTDRDGTIIYVNPAFEDVTGYKAEEAIGQKPSIIKSGVHPHEFYQELWATITSGRPFRAEVVNKKKNGELYFEDQLIVPLSDRSSDGPREPRWFVSIARDITDRKALEARIRHLAEHDELTGLPNRRSILGYAGRELRRAMNERHALSVLFIDLNNFKTINDGYGHRVGDLVLADAAKKIRNVVREEDICGRWGGDEFVVLLPKSGLDAARAVARRVRTALEAPAQVDDETPIIYLQASVGVAAFPEDGESVEELIRIADEGMYLAKGRPSGVAHVDDRDESGTRLELMLEIPNAVRLGQLRLHYQPILDLGTGRIKKAEALLRWRHPAKGTIRPGRFIGLAEQSRDIVAIDHWALREAIQTIGRLKGDGVEMDIAVNVSSRSLEDGFLLKLIAEVEKGDPGRLAHLILEVTEGSVVQSDRARKTLEALRKRGVRVSIDDFGTGYSCLAYLEEIPADIIKIDRRFVEGIGLKRGSEAIIRSLLSLAEEFGCRTLAEGVESAAQLEWLASAGCHEVQGYYIAKPMTARRLARAVSAQPFG